MERITSTDKWKDDWFLDISPYAKLVFIFLCENCDDAGFYTLSANFMAKQLKIPAQNIVDATRDLNQKILFSSDRKKVWVKNFLFYQKQLPLDVNNQDHKRIKLMLEKNYINFEKNKDVQFIIDSAESDKPNKKTSATKKVFVKPTLIEMTTYGIEYATKEKVGMADDWAKKLFNHYESNGWKIGGRSPMKNWKGAVRNAVLRDKEKLKAKSESKGKIGKIKKANNKIKNITIED